MRKNIKRSITAALAAAMIMSSAACGSNGNGTTDSRTEAATQTARTEASTRSERTESTTQAVYESTEAEMYVDACEGSSAGSAMYSNGATRNFKSGQSFCAEYDIDYPEPDR